MKSSLMLLLASCLAAGAETVENLNRRFTVQPGGTLVVDVDFGSIDVRTNATSEVIADVVRKVSRRSKSEETDFLSERPVTFSQEGNTITIRSRAKSKIGGRSPGSQRTEGHYAITVPASFIARLKSSGSGIAVSDLTGEVKAGTSGGGLKFNHLRGPLDAGTSGGGIRAGDCQGTLKLKTSGGGIQVSGGSGAIDGDTSGGSVVVKHFRGPIRVETSGGGITLENVEGKAEASTSGGSISASFASPPSDAVKLSTSGGGVTVQVPANSAFDLDASASGGSVTSQLPADSLGKPNHHHLKGPVNGGGKPVVLRTTGGSIRIEKL